jgi:NADPH-dependent 2,4-dienoyl-CoA reductase/sulfur reductase-like enzyme
VAVGHVVVVGAGLGGLRTVEQLRSAGHDGAITLVGAEPHPPYDRPPLSKQVLTGEWAPERAVLRGADALAGLGVDTRLGTRAVGLAPGAVELSDGTALRGDAVVVATGLAARTLPGQPAAARTLRTLDDALALKADLERASTLLVVGGGFIGAEVATAARGRGVEVTVLEALPVPAARALGTEVGALAGRLAVEAGVDLRTGTALAGFVEEPDGVAVELADGARLRADAALVAVGGVPQLDWITGVDASRGLVCGPTGRVEGLDGVWAVGDVAVRDGHRHEHWTSAGDQAAAVARDVLGAAPPPPSVPYFWSDQFGLKIQLFGWPEDADEVLPLHGGGLAGGPVRGTVAAYLAGGRLAAVVGFGAARLVARYRPAVAARAARAEVLETASALS